MFIPAFQPSILGIPDFHCHLSGHYKNSSHVSCRVIFNYLGLPRSRKKVWKMKKIPGQGKVGEFPFQSGKFRRKKKKIEKSRNFRILQNVHCFQASEKYNFINCKWFMVRNITFIMVMVWDIL